MEKKYRFGFDIWGLILFLIIMIPNFVWFAVPAPNDLLREESVTAVFDMIASICQVIMIILLCVLINNHVKKRNASRSIVICAVCVTLYFVSWILYYNGITNAVVIVGLTLFPCMAFQFYAMDRKNFIAMIPIVIFTICHFIYGFVNFVI